MTCCPVSPVSPISPISPLKPSKYQNQGLSVEVLASVDGVDCVVLADQVKSLDWKVREARKKAAGNTDVMLPVRAKIKSFLMIH